MQAFVPGQKRTQRPTPILTKTTSHICTDLFCSWWFQTNSPATNLEIFHPKKLILHKVSDECWICEARGWLGACHVAFSLHVSTCLRICPCLRATMFYLPETNKNHCLPCPCVSWNDRYTQLSHALKRCTKSSAPRKMLTPNRLWSFGKESLKFCFGKGDITRFLPQGLPTLVSHLRGLYSCIATKVCGRALMAWRTWFSQRRLLSTTPFSERDTRPIAITEPCAEFLSRPA